jgi:hypothetical protein
MKTPFRKLVLSASLVVFMSGPATGGEVVVLFDGKNLDAWEGGKGGAPAAGWVIEADGSLHRKENAGDIVSKQSFANFEMEWEWKIGKGGNSGVKYWVNPIAKQNLGFEYQLIDDEGHADAKNGAKRQTAAIYDIKGAGADKSVKPAGEWNTSKLVVKGRKLEHWLNGKLAVEAEMDGAEWKEQFGRSKYVKYADQGFAPGHGKILLQDHGDPVWFRNIRVTKLED